jgi:hypothetical protein
MPRTRLDTEKVLSRPDPTTGGIGGVGDALTERRRLTDRDLTLIDLLHEHDVLTGVQIARLCFTSPGRARHRLLELTRRRVLARFRHRLPVGSQHWRYTPGIVGATLHAAAHADPLPRPARVTARILALASSPRLEHRIATNEVFVALTHHARTHHTPAAGLPQLAVWWSERQATAAFGKIVRPDGYGEWIEHGRRVGFFLELDNGTEPLPRLLDKLTAYSHLTELGVRHPLLILLPTTVRESHLHQRLRTDPRLDRGDGSGLIVATAAADHLATTATSPADTVWLRPALCHRTRLIDLPDPGIRSATLEESW